MNFGNITVETVAFGVIICTNYRVSNKIWSNFSWLKLIGIFGVGIVSPNFSKEYLNVVTFIISVLLLIYFHILNTFLPHHIQKSYTF